MYQNRPRFVSERAMLEAYGLNPEIWAGIKDRMPGPVPELGLYDLKAVNTAFDTLAPSSESAVTDLAVILIALRKPESQQSLTDTSPAITWRHFAQLEAAGLIVRQPKGKGKKPVLTEGGLKRAKELIGA